MSNQVSSSQGAPSPSENKRANVGDQLPDFQLPNQDGQMVSIRDYVGQKSLVIFFYPKDESAGCTAEACSFRDQYEVFTEAGAELVGISSDSAESHKGFASHHRLPFVLLSDEGGKVRKLFRVPSTLGLLPGRVTYIVDKAGTIRYIFSSQIRPTQHVEEALKALRGLTEAGV